MDTERMKISAGVYGIRAKTWLRTVVQVAGIVLVLIGAYNFLFVSPMADAGALSFYREYAGLLGVSNITGGANYLMDVIAMAVGAIVSWFL